MGSPRTVLRGVTRAMSTGGGTFRAALVVMICLCFGFTQTSAAQVERGTQIAAIDLDNESRFAMQVAGGALGTAGLVAMAGGLWPWLQNELAVHAGQVARNANDRAAYQNAQATIDEARAADQSWGRMVLGLGAITAGLGLLTMLGATWFSCPDEVE